ncbi:MAG TPA: hypothetical protein VKU01_06385 [Bryobacteraceae bacterium]|nr:hypothetical protein [Bryobacteraceae bacterium]
MKLLCLSLYVCASAPLGAAQLSSQTLTEWDEYVRKADACARNSPFTWIDASPDRADRLRRGEVVVASAGGQTPLKVTGGLIHHWVGSAFIAGATAADAIAVTRDYDRYKLFYQPTVIGSNLLSRNGNIDRFSMLLMNKAVLTKTVVAGEYEASYVQLDPQRWYSIAQTRTLQEIEDYGSKDARKLPPDEGVGYLWRLHSIARFEERDGGVYIELEIMALSREVPGSLRWLVEPIVRRVSRNSLLLSLRQTRDAVTAAGKSQRLALGVEPPTRP